MNNSRVMNRSVISVIASFLSIAATVGSPAMAAKPSSTSTPETEACYGVVKAGKNDCAGPEHACAGLSKAADSSPTEHINLPKGTCARLTGGRLTMK